MTKRVTCAERLQEIRKDMGIKKGDCKTNKKYSTIPTIRVGPTKNERKKVHKQEQYKRYQIADWYLNHYLKREYRDQVYRKYLDFDELIDYAYQQAIQLQLMLKPHEVVDPNTFIKDESDDTYDIPRIQWKEYDEYCKDHPIHTMEDIIKRREKFLKKTKKVRKKYYKRGLMLYDPLFKNCQLNEKRMIENLERISAENEQRCQEFHNMMEKLVGNQFKNSPELSRFDEHTKVVQEQVKKHLKDLKKFEVQLPFYVDK